MPTVGGALPRQVGSVNDAPTRPRATDVPAMKSAPAALKEAKQADLVSALRLQIPAAVASATPVEAGGRSSAAHDWAADDTVAALAAGAEASGSAITTVSNAMPDSSPVERTINVPVQHPAWTEAVSGQIRWFAEQGVQRATLHLTPEHLGPVEVSLRLDKGQLDVNFSAASPETRVALEQSLPQLRDMLGGAGLSLGQAQVQQQMRQGSQNTFQPDRLAADRDVGESLARVPLRLGLVDEYA
jgi:flagellar hook-length control protein FliK